jgi:hypothetical protein
MNLKCVRCARHLGAISGVPAAVMALSLVCPKCTGHSNYLFESDGTLRGKTFEERRGKRTAAPGLAGDEAQRTDRV